MKNRQNRNRVSVVVFFNLVLLILAAQAHASDEDRAQAPCAYYGAYVAAPVSYVPVLVSNVEYYYNNGSFYRRFGDAYLAAPAPVGAVVRTIPRDCKPIVIDGVNYYIIHGSVYMQTINGYQVMPQKPFMIQKDAAADAEESFTVNIPNCKGGYTLVTIKKCGDRFIGPQGECYQEFPKVEQLKTKYAR